MWRKIYPMGEFSTWKMWTQISSVTIYIFSCKIWFVTIYAVLSRNLFCCDLRAFVWRKIEPKNVPVEKERQISGMHHHCRHSPGHHNWQLNLTNVFSERPSPKALWLCVFTKFRNSAKSIVLYCNSLSPLSSTIQHQFEWFLIVTFEEHQNFILFSQA